MNIRDIIIGVAAIACVALTIAGIYMFVSPKNQYDKIPIDQRKYINSSNDVVSVLSKQRDKQKQVEDKYTDINKLKRADI